MENKYFEREELFFDFWTKEFKEIMSKMDVGLLSLDHEILNKRMKTIYKDSKFVEDKRELVKEIIYLHPSGFYIYLSKSNVAEINFRIKIFYKLEHHGEIMMLLNTLKKNEKLN